MRNTQRRKGDQDAVFPAEVRFSTQTSGSGVYYVVASNAALLRLEEEAGDRGSVADLRALPRLAAYEHIEEPT